MPRRPPRYYSDHVERWARDHQPQLERTANHFAETGRWPDRKGILKGLLRDGMPDEAAEGFSELPPELGFLADDRVVLTLFGLNLTDAGLPILAAFARALGLARHRFRDEDHPVLRRADIVSALGEDEALIDAVSEVLLREAPFLGGGPGDQLDDWAREVTDGVVRYWSAESPDAYLEMRADELARSPQLASATAGPGIETSSGAGGLNSVVPAAAGTFAALAAGASFLVGTPVWIIAAVVVPSLIVGVASRRASPRLTVRLCLGVIASSGAAALLSYGTHHVLLDTPSTRKPRPASATPTVAAKPTATASGEEYDVMRPAEFPVLLKGSGTETLRASGYYGDERFVARGGLVIAHDYGTVEIKLFPTPVPCNLWYRGSPLGLGFDINVDATAATVESVPVGRPLREYGLSWNISRGNSSFSHGTEKAGSVTLTALNTSRGGFWRGRVRSPPGRTAGGKRQSFRGTFAAEWCDISPGRPAG